MRRTILGWLAVLLLALAGCAAPDTAAPGTVLVTGTVSLDGRPLADGEVLLVRQDAPGVIAAAQVTDGKFELRAVPGGYRVEIRRPVGPGGGQGKKGFVHKKESLPARYNTQSRLTATVTAEGPNNVEFQLESTPK